MDKNENISAQNDVAEQMAGDSENTQGGDDVASGENQEAEGGNGGENQDGDDTGGEDPAQEYVPKILTAVYPILYLSHQYKVGEELPANNPGMVEAWLDAGTAAWIQPVEKSPKARPMAAEPGLFGQAVPSEAENVDNLAGKVPRTKKRKR